MLDRYYDFKIDTNTANIPNVYTTRTIIAVWPAKYLNAVTERSNKLFKYVSINMYEARSGRHTDDKDFYKDVDLLKPVFKDGVLLRDDSLSDIRQRVLSQVNTKVLSPLT